MWLQKLVGLRKILKNTLAIIKELKIMELDELKSAWAQYDKKLNENLRLNEDIIRKMNLDNSKKEMKTPFGYEVYSVVSFGIFLLFVMSSTYKFADETKYLISGLLTIIICLIGLIFSIQKLSLLSKIDYHNTPVVDLQKNISIVKHKYLQYKKGEMFLFPIFALIAMPILAKGLGNLDIMAYPEKFIIALIGAIGLGYPILIWIYKNWYDKKLKNTNDFLQELNKFKKEE